MLLKNKLRKKRAKLIYVSFAIFS